MPFVPITEASFLRNRPQVTDREKRMNSPLLATPCAALHPSSAVSPIARLHALRRRPVPDLGRHKSHHGKIFSTPGRLTHVDLVTGRPVSIVELILWRPGSPVIYHHRSQQGPRSRSRREKTAGFRCAEDVRRQTPATAGSFNSGGYVAGPNVSRSAARGNTLAEARRQSQQMGRRLEIR